MQRPQDTFDAIVGAHRTLRALVEQMLTEWEPAALREHLARLQPLLSEHFASEERPGGFLDRVQRTHRHGEDHVEKLVAEHRAFELNLQGLLVGLQDGHPEAIEGTHDFARQLSEHERQEARLGLSDDPG